MNQDLSEKKILILFTAHTVGHQRVAENIGWWLTQCGARVVLREVLKSNPSELVRRFLRLHTWVYVHAPWFWKFLYYWGFWVVMMPFRMLAADWQKKEIAEIVSREKPDMVVTTQTSPSAVMSVLKRKKAYSGLWGIAFSDYHFHRGWAYPRADFYLTNIEEQVAYLLRLGVAKDRIHTIGLAMPPAGPIDKLACKVRLGLPQSSRVVLVASGSLGVRMPGNLLGMLDALHNETDDAHSTLCVLLVCGRNEEYYTRMSGEAQSRPWLKVYGFYEPMDELYAVSDAFVTKPGGLTVAEALRVSLPVFVTHYLPGQEELNMGYLKKQGLVVPLFERPFHDWPTAILEELVTGDKRQQLEQSEARTALVTPVSLETFPKFLAGLFHKTQP